MHFHYQISVGCIPPTEIPALPNLVEAANTGEAAVMALRAHPELLQQAIEQSSPPGDAPGVWVALAGADFPKHPNGRYAQIVMVGLRVHRGVDCHG